MQSRVLADTATAWCFRALSSTTNHFTLNRGFCAANRSRTADPAIHSGELESGPDVNKGTARGTTSTNDDGTSAKFVETEHMPSKEDTPKSPLDSSPKLKSEGVNQRLDPSMQQKRKNGSKVLEDVSCAGLDGSPWPEGEERIREEQNEDDKEYFRHHKASPLSELEFVDSRKPVSRVKDGTVDSGRGGEVIGWLPEQVDTAEDSLRRAAEIWRRNAMRGDPDAPHSRVLRALREEEF